MKRNSKEIDSQIQQGFELFDTNNTGLIDPNELKEIMDSMNFQEKNPFLYEIIMSLTESEDVLKKGGISAEDLISCIDQQIDDNQTEDYLKNIFRVFQEPNSNLVSLPTFTSVAREIGDELTEQEIKYLIQKAQLGSKELDFEEFYDIMNFNPQDPPDELNEQKVYVKNPSFHNNKSSSINKRGNERKRFNDNNDCEENNNINIYKSAKLGYKKGREENDIIKKDEPEVEMAIEGRSSGKKHYRRSREKLNKSNDFEDKERDKEKKEINEPQQEIRNKIIVVEQVINEEEKQDNAPKRQLAQKKKKVEKDYEEKEIYVDNNNGNDNENKGEQLASLRRYHRRYRESKSSSIPQEKIENINGGDIKRIVTTSITTNVFETNVVKEKDFNKKGNDINEQNDNNGGGDVRKSYSNSRYRKKK